MFLKAAQMEGLKAGRTVDLWEKELQMQSALQLGKKGRQLTAVH